jgi:hypothetical protein
MSLRPELTTITLRTRYSSGPAVTCTTEAGTGEYTGLKTVGGVVLTFTGCEGLGAKCSSAEAAEGEVVTRPLEGVLGITAVGEPNITDKIGLDLFPRGKTGAVMEFSCGTTPVVVQGSAIGVSASNAMKLTSTVAYSYSLKYKQNPESFVGEPKDILNVEGPFGLPGSEQIRLKLKTIVTSEEGVEINAFI